MRAGGWSEGRLEGSDSKSNIPPTITNNPSFPRSLRSHPFAPRSNSTQFEKFNRFNRRKSRVGAVSTATLTLAHRVERIRRLMKVRKDEERGSGFSEATAKAYLPT